MGEAGQGRVRLGILLASIAALAVIGVKTVTGPTGASATHTSGHGTPGRIIAVASRRRIPPEVRKDVSLPPAHGSAEIRAGGVTYLLGGSHQGPQGARRPVASVLRSVGHGAPTRVAKLPTAVSGAAPAAVGDRLYAIGGRLANGQLSGDIQEYDVATQHSVIAARLPKPLWRASAITLDGYVYVMGGVTSSGPTASILRFDPWRDVVFHAGHLPLPATDGAGAAARLRRGYLVGARAPGAGRLNFAITLRALRTVSRPRGDRSRTRASRSRGSSAAGPAGHSRGSAG
jgi:hypothetical protein